jgi:hypothetical protein
MNNILAEKQFSEICKILDVDEKELTSFLNYVRNKPKIYMSKQICK